jgi:hypothetical protein
MTEGTLIMQPSGLWAIQVQGREPANILAGEVFLLEVQGHRQMQQTRMVFRRFEEGYGEYYSVDGYELRDGLRAGFLDPAGAVREGAGRTPKIRK